MRGTVSSHTTADDARKPADNTASSHTLLEGRLGYQVESALLVRALTHRSYAYENGGLPTNERLEFLGDSVLGLVVTDTLYRTHPDLPEGQLAKLRAAVVNSRALAEVGRGLDLGSFIRLGRGEEGTGGRDKASILADTLEAVIGAVYLDQGLEAASELVHRLFDPLIEKSSNLGAGLDWKTSLQELTAAEGLGVPEYLVTETGPDHEKTFTAAARVGGVSYGTGTGRSKKEAEQQAAESAWRAIRAAADEREAAAREAAATGASSEAVAAEVTAASSAAAADTPSAADPATTGSATAESATA
ncbi:ribonuclease III [Streptomyces sp. SudanB25_2051]|uniref:ribonuclease III n=1 Tax=Streptomyces sp. SudanB25_2051 TaxID=3035275 RepID=UPI003F57ECE7